jgi:hypothetical protein
MEDNGGMLKKVVAFALLTAGVLAFVVSAGPLPVPARARLAIADQNPAGTVAKYQIFDIVGTTPLLLGELSYPTNEWPIALSPGPHALVVVAVATPGRGGLTSDPSDPKLVDILLRVTLTIVQ